MKKLLTLALALLLIAASIPVASLAEEPVELVFWHYYEEGSSLSKNLQKLFDRYHEENPNVTIRMEIKQFSDLKQDLMIAAVTGGLPDLVYIDNCDTVSFAAMGILADLSDAFADYADFDDYFPAIMDCCKYDGKLYAVPALTNAIGFYYNKDMLEEAGVDVPTNWEELRAAAKACTTDEHLGYAMCLFPDEAGTFNYLMYQLQAGGDYYNLNSEAGIKALTFIKSLVDDGSMSKDVLTWSQRDVGRQFTSQNVAIIELGCWYIDEWEEVEGLEFGTFTTTDVCGASVYGGENLTVVDNENTQASIDFVKWFMQYDINKQWNLDAQHFPARNATLTDPDYQQNPNWKPIIDQIPVTSARPVDPQWPEVSLGYQYAFTAVVTGEATPEEAAARGQEIIDAARQ